MAIVHEEQIDPLPLSFDECAMGLEAVNLQMAAAVSEIALRSKGVGVSLDDLSDLGQIENEQLKPIPLALPLYMQEKLEEQAPV
tara:strand:+ start:339 stop:590 length:252 start_codon:yes stop_codon:yes gene_type:complete